MSLQTLMPNAGEQDSRRQQRIEPQRPILVVNINTQKPMGALVNISLEGLMVMSDTIIDTNRIYQISLQLNDPVNGHKHIDLGVDCLWNRSETENQRYWAGFQIIDASRSSLNRIEMLIRDVDHT